MNEWFFLMFDRIFDIYRPGLSGAGKIWENRFFTGNMDLHGANCTQIGTLTCQGSSRTCRIFFTFTFKAVRVTFLKVILKFAAKSTKSVILNFSGNRFIFVTTSISHIPPHHCYIAHHCLSIHVGYWCKKT